jgi:hypothetical protein
MTANLTGGTMAESGSAIVRSLRCIGAMTVRHVEGEPVRYVIDPHRLKWVTPHKLVQGTYTILAGLPSDPILQPKLAHILDLFRRGWSAASKPRPRHLRPTDTTFWKEFSKSKYYFLAMLESGYIIEKLRKHGIGHNIRHDMGHSYYVGLVKLDDKKQLQAITDMADNGAKDDEFQKYLKKNGVMASSVDSMKTDLPDATIAVINDAEDEECAPITHAQIKLTVPIVIDLLPTVATDLIRNTCSLRLLWMHFCNSVSFLYTLPQMPLTSPLPYPDHHTPPILYSTC